MNPTCSPCARAALLLAALQPFLQACSDSRAEAGGADTFAGTWQTVVTLRDCRSGAALADPPASPVALHGLDMARWAHHGDRRYTAQFRFYRYGSDGKPAGTSVVTSARRFSADFSRFNGDTRGERLDASGTVIATTCVAEVGTRLR
jgi:hypothetical protein